MDAYFQPRPDLPAATGRGGPRLLVSVRSQAEAREALAGGADILDAKEPGRGPLGRPDASTVADIVAQGALASATVVSVALGELAECEGVVGRQWHLAPGVTLAKTAFAGERGRDDWSARFLRLRDRLAGQADLVPVAYADAPRASSPSMGEVIRFAARARCDYLLIDTFDKANGRLLDWVSPETLCRLVALCEGRGIRLALAGSLTADILPIVAACRPFIIAVRGAACRGGRQGQIDRHLVGRLKELIQGSQSGLQPEFERDPNGSARSPLARG